ncbi:MAG: hypothetical protein CK426_08970 [Legionella sp.]|nr:MAG: hypothetical protein CK426_08970 [Legionella sp.]
MTDLNSDLSFPFEQSDHEQAFALWIFVALRIPRFTNETALSITQSLTPKLGEDPKKLAKRLRKAMAEHGVAIKNTAAIEAAARMLGHKNWHTANSDKAKYRLKVSGLHSSDEKLYVDWRSLTDTVCELCRGWAVDHGAKLFEVHFGPSYMIINSIPSLDVWPDAKAEQMWPLFAVNPIEEDAEWLNGAASMLETVRRHLEETGKATLDGVAVLQLCENYSGTSSGIDWHASTMQDVCNTELILLREDNELMPGYEIARGNEHNCWAQIELAIKDDKKTDITASDGAWYIGEARYVWQLSTLRPLEFVPELVVRQLGESEVNKLLHRFFLSRKIFNGRIPHNQVTKRLDYLGRLGETFRVDLHRILLELQKVGHDWKSYGDLINEEVEFTSVLPVGFVIRLIEYLKLTDPNILFQKPNRSELVKLDDDGLLRSLIPRVDCIVYKIPRGISAAVKEQVTETIADFSANIQLQNLTSNGGSFSGRNHTLPYLVYANDGEEFRLTLLSYGLVIFAGVTPRLIPTNGLIELPEDSLPYAIGNSLYLDIDFDDESKRQAA